MHTILKEEESQSSVHQTLDLEQSNAGEKPPPIFKSKLDLLLEKAGFQRKNTLLGLDIGASGVKIVEMSKAKKGWRLLNAGVVEFDLSHKGLSRPDTLARLALEIQNALRGLKIKTKKVVFSISGDNFVQRLVTLPQMPKKELERVLTWEVKKYIDLPSNQLCIDYLARTNRKKSTENWDVFLVAVPKRKVDESISLLRSAGLGCVSLETKATALTGGILELASEYREKTFAVLDIGAKTSVLSIVRDGFLVFTREIEWGGENLTFALVHKLKCAHRTAESQKREVGLSSELTEKGSDPKDERHVVAKTLEEETNNLIHEIINSFKYHFTQFPEDEVKVLFLTGGTSALVGLEGFLSHRLEIKAELFNPLDFLLDMENFEARKYMEEMSGRLGVGLGLGTWRR